jgi:hypothetical protein
MIYKFMCFHNSPIYQQSVVSSSHYMIYKALCLDKFIACILGKIPKYDKPYNLNTTVDA